MIGLLSLVAQSVTSTPTSPADPSLWTQFGPFAICFVLMGIALVDQRLTIRRQEKELREDRKQIVEELAPLATRMLDALKEADSFVRDVAHRKGPR